MDHPDLKKNGRKNLEYAAMSFREDFYLSFEPTPTSEVCNCQVIKFLYRCFDFIITVFRLRQELSLLLYDLPTKNKEVQVLNTKVAKMYFDFKFLTFKRYLCNNQLVQK